MQIIQFLLSACIFLAILSPSYAQHRKPISKTIPKASSSKSKSSSSRKSPAPRLSPIMQMPESIISLPPDYDPSQKYPLLILMPYTGGNSIDFFNKYLREARIDTPSIDAQFADFLEIYRDEYGEDRSFILMLTYGDGSKAHHNYEGFTSCIEQMENRLNRDLKKFIPRYAIDTNRIFIGGVSLGGDLSWALPLRNPDRFQGAIVTASRCSYPPPSGILEQLAAKNYSIFMVMGMSESPDRLSGISYARKLLNAAGLEHSYREMPYLEHDRAPIWLFMQGIEYVMFTPHAPIQKITDSLTIATICYNYPGELISKKYKMEEKTEILHRGGGVWQLQNESSSNTTLRVCSNPKREVILQFDDGLIGRVNLTAHLTLTKQEDFALVIPEQIVNGYIYKGIGTDIDAQQHGTWSQSGRDAFLSIDLEKYQVGRPNFRTTFSFFSLISNKP
jgi:predicted esterase